MSVQDKLQTLINDIDNAYSTIGTRGGVVPEDKNTNNLANSISSIPGEGTEILGVVETAAAQELGLSDTAVKAINKGALAYASVTQADIENAEHFSFEDGYWYYDGEKIEDRDSENAKKLASANLLPKMVGTTENFRAETDCKMNAVMIDVEVGSSTNFNCAFIRQDRMEMHENSPKLGLVYAKITGDGSNITTMRGMFQSCSNLVICELPSDLSSLTNTDSMFQDCKSLSVIDTTPFTNVTDATNMFSWCESLTTINTAPFTNVTNANGMFSACTSLTSIDTSPFTNVTSASGMFNGCTSLVNPVDTAPFANATSVDSFYNNCPSLTEARIDFGAATSAAFLCYYCPSLTSVVISNLKAATNAQYIFAECTSLQYADISGMNLTRLTTYGNMFLRVPETCHIVVKDQADKNWMASKYPTYTNVTIKGE